MFDVSQRYTVQKIIVELSSYLTAISIFETRAINEKK